jgi:hypothetical protein
VIAPGRPHRSASPGTTALLSGWCRARLATSPAAGDGGDRARPSSGPAGVGLRSPIGATLLALAPDPGRVSPRISGDGGALD